MTADRKVDWDELKRLHAAIGQSTKDNYLWSAAIEAAFPAILAEREAARGLRDAAMLYAEHQTEMNLLELVDKALALDKETQNEG